MFGRQYQCNVISLRHSIIYINNPWFVGDFFTAWTNVTLSAVVETL